MDMRGDILVLGNDAGMNFDLPVLFLDHHIPWSGDCMIGRIVIVKNSPFFIKPQNG